MTRAEAEKAKEATIQRVWKQNRHLWAPEYGPEFNAYERTIGPLPPVTNKPVAADLALPIYTFVAKSLIKYEGGQRLRVIWVECDGVILEGTIDTGGFRRQRLKIEKIKEMVAEAKRHAIYPNRENYF